MSVRRRRCVLDYTTDRRPAPAPAPAGIAWPLVGPNPRRGVSPSPAPPQSNRSGRRPASPASYREIIRRPGSERHFLDAIREYETDFLGQDTRHDRAVSAQRFMYDVPLPTNWRAFPGDWTASYRSAGGPYSGWTEQEANFASGRHGLSDGAGVPPMYPMDRLHYQLRWLHVKANVAMGEYGYQFAPERLRDGSWDRIGPRRSEYHWYRAAEEEDSQCTYYTRTISEKIEKERRHADAAFGFGVYRAGMAKLYELRRKTDDVCRVLQGRWAAHPDQGWYSGIGQGWYANGVHTSIYREHARLGSAVRRAERVLSALKDTEGQVLQDAEKELEKAIQSRMFLFGMYNSLELAFLIAHDLEVEHTLRILGTELAILRDEDYSNDPSLAFAEAGFFPILSTLDGRHSTQVFMNCMWSLVKFSQSYCILGMMTQVADYAVGMRPERRLYAHMFALTAQFQAAKYIGSKSDVTHCLIDNMNLRMAHGACVVCVLAAVLYNALVFQMPLMDDPLRPVVAFVGGTEGHMGAEDAVGAGFVLSILQLFLGPRFTQFAEHLQWIPRAPEAWAGPGVDASAGVGLIPPAYRRQDLPSTYQKTTDPTHDRPPTYPKTPKQTHDRKATDLPQMALPRMALPQMALPPAAALAGGLSPDALHSFFKDTPPGTGDRCTAALVSAAGLGDPRRKDGQAMNVARIAEAVAAEMTPAVLIKAVDRMMAAHRHPGA